MPGRGWCSLALWGLCPPPRAPGFLGARSRALWRRGLLPPRQVWVQEQGSPGTPPPVDPAVRGEVSVTEAFGIYFFFFPTKLRQPPEAVGQGPTLPLKSRVR